MAREVINRVQKLRKKVRRDSYSWGAASSGSESDTSHAAGESNEPPSNERREKCIAPGLARPVM